MVALPDYRFHGVPLGLGIIVEDSATCSSCGDARGFSYSGTLYNVDDDSLAICPWCIADGSAHSKLGVTFNHANHLPDTVSLPNDLAAELFQRTPGFPSWQDREWLCHNNLPCRFMGDLAVDEALSPDWDAVERLMQSYGHADFDRAAWAEMIEHYEPGNPSIFKYICTQTEMVFYQIDAP